MDESILEYDIKIMKIGYRMRLLNKLKEGKIFFYIVISFLDSKSFFSKKKDNNALIITDKKDMESCKCYIF